MKKAIPLVLAVVMCLSLCACGKSEKVISVEHLISSIGEVSIESTDIVNTARDAYNALSDKDKEKVENANTLHDATLESLTIRCTELNSQSSILSDGVIIVWENVGGEKFWNYFRNVLRFTSLSTIDSLKLQNDLGMVNLLMWNTGYAMEKDAFKEAKGISPNRLTDDDFIYIANLCMPYAVAYAMLSEMEPALNSDITQFIHDYKDTYTDEADLLKEWMLESSMFVEFAMEPNGNLNDYKTTQTEYETEMSRFQKEAKMAR